MDENKAFDKPFDISTYLYYSCAPHETTNVALITLVDNDITKPAATDVVVVIDGSSSMHGEKFDMVKSTLQVLITACAPGSTLTLIVFSTYAKCVLDKASFDNAADISRIIQGMSSSGSTDMHSGLKLAIEKIEEHKMERPVVFAFTDGVLNNGLRGDNLLSWFKTAWGEKKGFLWFGAFGDDADVDIIRGLASTNTAAGFRHVPNSDFAAFAEEMGSLIACAQSAITGTVTCLPTGECEAFTLPTRGTNVFAFQFLRAASFVICFQDKTIIINVQETELEEPTLSEHYRLVQLYVWRVTLLEMMQERHPIKKERKDEITLQTNRIVDELASFPEEEKGGELYTKCLSEVSLLLTNVKMLLTKLPDPLVLNRMYSEAQNLSSQRTSNYTQEMGQYFRQCSQEEGVIDYEEIMDDVVSIDDQPPSDLQGQPSTPQSSQETASPEITLFQSSPRNLQPRFQPKGVPYNLDHMLPHLERKTPETTQSSPNMYLDTKKYTSLSVVLFICNNSTARLPIKFYMFDQQQQKWFYVFKASATSGYQSKESYVAADVILQGSYSFDPNPHGS
jgi:uncharacterized protein YegL